MDQQRRWLSSNYLPRRTLCLVTILPAVRADLLRRLHRSDEAARYYGEALSLASTDSERRFLSRRLAETTE